METINGPLTIQIDARTIDSIATSVQEFHQTETGTHYPLWAVARAVRSWLALRADDYVDDLAELLTSPGRSEANAFAGILASSTAATRVLDDVAEYAEESVFTGYRKFSRERLGAMAVYIAERGREVYKTKLNKLLFYSDFINFYLNGTSISGSKYVHVPFGPVPEHYGEALEQLSDAGRVELMPAGHKSILIKSVASADRNDALSREETAVIDWVLENYGKLSASEISDLSHGEKAYRFTRPGEQIAYRYAAFFETLPLKK
ncbi:MAG: Panacea domain-containing protein [Pyrinomonadaceae bacterium]